MGLGAAFCGVWVWAAENLEHVEQARLRFEKRGDERSSNKMTRLLFAGKASGTGGNHGIRHLTASAPELRPDIDPDAGALAITSFIMGLTLQLWVNPEACDATVVSKELGRWLSRR
jgi:hypothetical protein